MSTRFHNSRSMSSRSSQDRNHNSMNCSNPVLLRFNPYPFPVFEYPIIPSISSRSSQANNKHNKQFQPPNSQFSSSQDNNHYQSKPQPPNASNLLESLYNVGWYLRENRNSGLSPSQLLENAMIGNNLPCDVIIKSSSDLLTFYCFVVCCSVLVGFVEDANRVSAEIKAIEITIENLSRNYLKIAPKEADFDELVSSDFPIDDVSSDDRSYKQRISPVPSRFTTQLDDRYESDRFHNEVDTRHLSPPRNGWNQQEQKRNYPGPPQESPENYPFYTDGKRNLDTYRSPPNVPSTFSPHPKYEDNWSSDQRRQSFDSLERTNSIPRFSDRCNVEESYLKPLPIHPSAYEELKVTIRGAISDDRVRREESIERRRNSEQIIIDRRREESIERRRISEQAIIDRRREESLERRRNSEQLIIDRRREESIERRQNSEQLLIDRRRGNSQLGIKGRKREESFECKQNSQRRIKESTGKREEGRERNLNSERRIKDRKIEESSERRTSERRTKDRKREGNSGRKLNSERIIKGRNRVESSGQRHNSERRIKDRKRDVNSERRRNSERRIKDKKTEESREGKGNSERRIKDGRREESSGRRGSLENINVGVKEDDPSPESWRGDSYKECTGNDYGWVRTVSSADSPQATFENLVSSSTSPDRLTDNTRTRFKPSSDENFNIFRTVSNERASPAHRSTFQAQTTETHQLLEPPYKVTSQECPNPDKSTDHQHLLEPFYKVGHSLRKYRNLHSNPAELLEHALSANNLSFDSVMGSSKDHSVFYCVVVCSSVQISFAKARIQTNAEIKAIQIAIENLCKPYLSIVASDGGMGKLVHSDSPKKSSVKMTQ